MRYALLIFFSFLFFIGSAQNYSIEGIVQSYKGKKIRIIKRAQKNVYFNGALKGATITLLKNNTTIGQEKTDKLGEFELKFEEHGNYQVVVSKKGHGIVSFGFRIHEKSPKKKFIGLNFLLKENDDENVFIGTFIANQNGRLSFLPVEDGAIKSKHDVLVNNIGLTQKTLEINNSVNPEAELSRVRPRSWAKDVLETPNDSLVLLDSAWKSTVQHLEEVDSVLKLSYDIRKEFLRSLEGGDKSTAKLYVDSLKNVLATLDTNTTEYKILRDQLVVLKSELTEANQLTTAQQNELEANEKKLFYFRLLLVSLVALVLFGAWVYWLRKRYTKDLEVSNAKIKESQERILSSIRYASSIQNAYLQSESGLTDLFKTSFIYNQPKDIISGDFYWYGNNNGIQIIAVADCTGHGVPGAMLTILGHSIMSDAVNNLNKTNPKEILLFLNDRLRQTFEKNKEFMEHGMDCCIIAYDKNKKLVQMAGAVNGLYKIDKQGLHHLDSFPLSVGYHFSKDDLELHSFEVEEGDKLVLYTDGYCDQFNESESPEKYNLARFEALLKELGKSSFGNQSAKKLEQEINNWKGNADQLDDMLVLGVEI